MAVPRRLLFLCALPVLLCACGRPATLPVSAGTGANPTLVDPHPEVIPTIRIARPEVWQAGASPTTAPGLAVNAFATGLQHPRWLHVLPNGDVLVAETAGPPQPGKHGLKNAAMKYAMKLAGSAVPSPNRITLLRDTDGDGAAETRTTFLQDLNSPFGMALAGGYLYVANTDAIVRVPYVDGDMQGRGVPEKFIDLPAGSINHHWTKDIVAHPDGTRLYATVGSNSDHGERGIELERDRACVLEVDLAKRSARTFASGLRNPNGASWNPTSGQLWVAVNERDELGGDLVPDYITSVSDGAFYGWPYSYYGRHADARVQPQRDDLVAKAVSPDYAVGSHAGSLGLAFNRGDQLGDLHEGAFVGQHGSWNRIPPSGYKVIFVPFSNGKPSGTQIDVLTGFLDDEGHARGRPVGVAIDRRGALLVADDVGNVIWRVTSGARAQ